MPMQPSPRAETVSGEVLPRVRWGIVMSPPNAPGSTLPRSGPARACGSGSVQRRSLEGLGRVRATHVRGLRLVVRAGGDPAGELLGVVLGVVAEGAARAKVPP